jgi:hypothetical protein
VEATANLQKTIDQYRLAQKEFVKGNPTPFKEMCSHADDVTMVGGWGGFEKGWAAQVERRYDWASARFAIFDSPFIVAAGLSRRDTREKAGSDAPSHRAELWEVIPRHISSELLTSK